MTAPHAADLPDRSLVLVGDVMLDRRPVGEFTSPWLSEGGLRWTDAEVQDALDNGATVLRYGNGEA